MGTITNFDSGSISIAANLAAAEAYHLASGHANTPGLELVSLSDGGGALKVTQGGGTGDLTIDADVSAQSVGAAPVLYYKDGSVPISNTDGTVIPWTSGPNWKSGNGYTASWSTGEVDDADEGRYYWIRPGAATNITTGTVRVRYDYTQNLAFASTPPATLTYRVGHPITAVALPAGEHGSETYTYTLSPLPAGVSFDATQRTPTGTPTQEGITNATYTVNDGNTTKTATIRIEVIDLLRAPQNVQVTFQNATTALVAWDALTGDVETYEVSVAEGASPGSTYIRTDSTRPRYLLTGLKRGTQYTFTVRGRNAKGAGDASSPVTERTPIASLHNALFFKECVNYFDDGARVSEHGNASNIIREPADNDYTTFTTETDLDINIAQNTQPTRVDAVFIKSKGVTRHSGTPTGGSGTGWTNEALPETVENWEGTEVSTTVLGFQHHLLLLDSHFTATSVRVQFEGTNVEIYEMMMLEFLLEINSNSDFTDISPDYVDRSAVIHQSPSGDVRRSSPLGAERNKWETTYVVKIVPGKTLLESVDEFVYQMGENPNIVHAQEPSRYPARIHPASFLLTRVPTRLRGDNKLLGDVVQFRVGEQ